MSENSGKRSPITAVVACLVIGVVVVFVISTGDRETESPGRGVDEACATDGGEPFRESDDLVSSGQLERRLARNGGAAGELDNAGSVDGEGPLILSPSAQIALRIRIDKRLQECRARLEEVFNQEGWGAEYTRSFYLLMRREMALEKLLAGDFEVEYAPGAHPVRHEGQPDFMSLWTSDYRDGRQLYVKVTLDEADEALLASSRQAAAEETLIEWQSVVDAFNALEFDERSMRIRQSREAQQTLSDLVHNRGGSATYRSGEARRAELRRLHEQRLPWYLAVDEVRCLVRIRSSAREAAQRHAGF